MSGINLAQIKWNRTLLSLKCGQTHLTASRKYLFLNIFY